MPIKQIAANMPYPEAPDTSRPLIFESPEDATYAMQELLYNLIPCFLRPIITGWRVGLIPAHMDQESEQAGWVVSAEDDTLVLCDDLTWKVVLLPRDPNEIGH